MGLVRKRLFFHKLDCCPAVQYTSVSKYLLAQCLHTILCAENGRYLTTVLGSNHLIISKIP